MFAMGWWGATALLVASVPIVLVAASLNSMFFDAEFYGTGQARWAVGRSTEYTIDQLRPINRALVQFFRWPTLSLPAALQDEGADRAVFNPREVGHMNDVRDIVRLIGRLENLALTLATAVVLGRFVAHGMSAWRWTLGRLAAGAGLTLALVGLIGALGAIDFERLFLTFHVLSFDNDMWQLDPRKDNLIRFFPFEFWFDATVTVAVRSVLWALIVGGVSLVVRRRLRGRTGERAVP